MPARTSFGRESGGQDGAWVSVTFLLRFSGCLLPFFYGFGRLRPYVLRYVGACDPPPTICGCMGPSSYGFWVWNMNFAVCEPPPTLFGVSATLVSRPRSFSAASESAKRADKARKTTAKAPKMHPNAPKQTPGAPPGARKKTKMHIFFSSENRASKRPPG